MRAAGSRRYAVTLAALFAALPGQGTASAYPQSIPPSQPSASVQPSELVRITSIDLEAAPSSRRFKLVIRSAANRPYATFWVRGGRTLVIDLRNAYTPFRGRAVGELQVPAVAEVRASQFLEREMPIARIELDLTDSYAASAEWVGNDLEIAFEPGTPGFVGTGRTREPAKLAGAPPPAGERARPARPEGRDNPFDPLLKAPGNIDMTNVLTRDLPDVETLILTGIVYRSDNESESIALLRDANGLTYRLKKGDRVKFGFVAGISQNEIVCRLDRFGRVYEFKLSLDIPPER